MKQLFLSFSLMAAALLMQACESQADGDGTALRWADAYFHGDYPDAADYVTEESLPLLRLLASNMTEADIKQLQELNTRVELQDYTPLGDTLATATVRVTDYMQPDSIGRAGSVHAEGTFLLSLVRRNGRWKVRMASLPRSGRQNPD